MEKALNIYQQHKVDSKTQIKAFSALFYPIIKSVGAQMGRPNIGKIKELSNKEINTLKIKEVKLDEGYDKEGVYWGYVPLSPLFVIYSKSLEFVLWLRLDFSKPFYIDCNKLVQSIRENFFYEQKYLKDSEIGSAVAYRCECYNNGVISYMDLIVELVKLIKPNDVQIIVEIIDLNRLKS